MLGVLQLALFLFGQSKNFAVFNNSFSAAYIVVAGGSILVYYLFLWGLKDYLSKEFRTMLATYAGLLIALLIIIGFSGADSAIRSLSDSAVTEVRQKSPGTLKLSLLRAVSSGVFGLDSEEHRIVFLQNSEVDYFSSPVQG
jgi:hypothetical protein